MANPVSFCSDCGHEFEAGADRAPCPVCGGTARTFSVQVEAGMIAITGGVANVVVSPPTVRATATVHGPTIQNSHAIRTPYGHYLAEVAAFRVGDCIVMELRDPETRALAFLIGDDPGAMWRDLAGPFTDDVL